MERSLTVSRGHGLRTQQARSSMDVRCGWSTCPSFQPPLRHHRADSELPSLFPCRFGIANYLSRRSESLTAEQGKTLLAGLTLDTKGRIPLTLMVEELVRRG